ncbi:hypothetical protein WKI71_25640 [Streptomyces sp. MS1.AVA.1]|uniref:Uncharacterized protein n=1 Tax=Streptomyces machairae TaxID=3134109 RepID=A0ABU8UNT3_9ACTN
MAHSERERVSLTEVVQAARTLAVTVLRTVGTKRAERAGDALRPGGRPTP